MYVDTLQNTNQMYMKCFPLHFIIVPFFVLAKILKWRKFGKNIQPKEIWQNYWDFNCFSIHFIRNSSENSSVNCFITSSLNYFTSKNGHLNQRRKSVLELDRARLNLNPISGRPIRIFEYGSEFFLEIVLLFNSRVKAFFWIELKRFRLSQAKAEIGRKIFWNCSLDMSIEAALN